MARRVLTPELVHLIHDLDRRWCRQAIQFESNAAFDGIRVQKGLRIGVGSLTGPSRAAA